VFHTALTSFINLPLRTLEKCVSTVHSLHTMCKTEYKHQETLTVILIARSLHCVWGVFVSYFTRSLKCPPFREICTQVRAAACPTHKHTAFAETDPQRNQLVAGGHHAEAWWVKGQSRLNGQQSCDCCRCRRKIKCPFRYVVWRFLSPPFFFFVILPFLCALFYSVVRGFSPVKTGARIYTQNKQWHHEQIALYWKKCGVPCGESCKSCCPFNPRDKNISCIWILKTLCSFLS
jgi:hypothetical protein